MVALINTFILFTLAAFAAAHPSTEVAKKRQAPDWGNYVYIASQFSGIVGQNIGLIALPGNRAVCPSQLWDLQSCADSFESECIEERFAFEWCLQHRITVANCGSDWINVTLSCMGGIASDCTASLVGLADCADGITVPEVPPP